MKRAKNNNDLKRHLLRSDLSKSEYPVDENENALYDPKASIRKLSDKFNKHRERVIAKLSKPLYALPPGLADGYREYFEAKALQSGRRKLNARHSKSQFKSPQPGLVHQSADIINDYTSNAPVRQKQRKGRSLNPMSSTIVKDSGYRFSSNYSTLKEKPSGRSLHQKNKKLEVSQELPDISKNVSDPQLGKKSQSPLSKFYKPKKARIDVSITQVRETARKLIDNQNDGSKTRVLSMQHDTQETSKSSLKKNKRRSRRHLKPLHQRAVKEKDKVLFKSVQIKGGQGQFKKIHIMKHPRLLDESYPMPDVDDSDEVSQTTPKNDDQNTSGISDIAQKFVPRVKSKLYSHDSNSSFHSKKNLTDSHADYAGSSQVANTQIEQTDEYGIVQEMISEIWDYDKFRHIEKSCFKSRDNISNNPALLAKRFPLTDSASKPIKIQKAFLKFQASYVEK